MAKAKSKSSSNKKAKSNVKDNTKSSSSDKKDLENKSIKKSKPIKSNTIVIAIIILIILVVFGFSIANSGPKAKAGDKVSVWYTGKLQSGEIFDTNVEEMAEGTDIVREKFEPLSFTVGAGQMIKGFDNAVVGMKVGEKKTVELAPDEAYGSYKAEYVQTLPLAEFESTFKPVDDLEEGMVLYYQSQNGRIGSFMIKTIGRDFVTIDFNHELAGKSLIFDIELASIDE